jgi:hypothetical protein
VSSKQAAGSGRECNVEVKFTQKQRTIFGAEKVLADRPPTRLFLPADSVKRPRPSYEAGVRHVVFQVLSYLGKMLRIPSSQRYSICTIKHHCLVLQGESISVVSESHLHSCTHNARAYRASWSRKASDAEKVELSPVLQECLRAKARTLISCRWVLI